MKIQQIEYERDGTKSFNDWINEMIEKDNVYLLFNRYGTIRSFYESSKHLDPEEVKFEDCWRIIPFRDYYKRNADKPYFTETLRMRLDQKMALVSIEF